jgi:isopenicillin N synthase-like dioxygenase
LARGTQLTTIPLIDLSPLFDGRDPALVAAQLGETCEGVGFFYAAGHGVPPALRRDLEAAARRFFALPDHAKAQIAMARGGRAWRGWFPLGGELTSGEPDGKEGLYLGAELEPADPRVTRGVPLHGPNLWPAEVPELKAATLAYLDAVTRVGHALMRGLSLALGLEPEWFHHHATAEPLILFRLFLYPPRAEQRWGVGEHTDYGLLTLLAQDDAGGLEVKTPRGWVEAPPIEDTFVCNIGDMLERMSRGRFRSTPHRVRNTSDRPRLSMPLFFDPAWDCKLQPIPGHSSTPSADRERWDRENVHDFEGTYGDYVLKKVARVFPALARAVDAPAPGR